MTSTKLKKLKIDKFRALNEVEIELGDQITVVCGKNGTSKSSILGIAAQIFSFEKDYVKNKEFSFQEIAGGSFKSQYSDHFRISEEFDKPGSMQVSIDLHDAYTDQSATARLILMKRGKSPRAVVRKNSTVKKGENSSRNFTHPVVFLSLKRLYPIADRDYKVIDFSYLSDHKNEFIGLTNELLNRQSSLATGTSGTISSAVSHGDNYDQESVSAGEDNAGQIVLALMSFRKLKEEYADYKGGLLLIDEADAGLFPTAQINLLKILERECRSLNIQVVMTSHSPTLIEHAYEQSQRYRKNYKTVYLSNTFGAVQVMQDWSWSQISADITTRTAASGEIDKLPKINVYFEDGEAADLFTALISRQPIKKFTNPLPEVTLGCSNYLNLINKGIAEFSERSVVCLDSDAASLLGRSKPRAVVLLPGALPPDQAIFEHLYNLPAEHDFWKNELNYARPNFTQSSAEIIRELEVTGEAVDVGERIAAYRGSKKIREVFKRFYKDNDFQKLVATASKPYNPWKHWADVNPERVNEFLISFKASMQTAMTKGFAVDPAKVSALEIRPKKVS